MQETGSTIRWVSDFALPDDGAARHIWDRFSHRLVALANQQLQRKSWGGGDEEDVELIRLLWEQDLESRGTRITDGS